VLLHGGTLLPSGADGHSACSMCSSCCHSLLQVPADLVPSTPGISSALFPSLFGKVSALQVAFAMSSNALSVFNSWESTNSISGFRVWMVLNGGCVRRDIDVVAAKLSIVGGLDASEGQSHFCFILAKPKAGTVSSAESSTHFFSPCFPLFLLPSHCSPLSV